MGRAKATPPAKAVILPPELDDDEDCGGGGIPDEDGWIHVKEKPRDEEKPKRRPARRRSPGNG
jgi:hypothetical protein